LYVGITINTKNEINFQAHIANLRHRSNAFHQPLHISASPWSLDQLAVGIPGQLGSLRSAIKLTCHVIQHVDANVNFDLKIERLGLNEKRIQNSSTCRIVAIALFPVVVIPL